MIALRFPISTGQAIAYQPQNPGEIDISTNELIIRCDVNDVTTTSIRVGTIINKLKGVPYSGKRDVRYDFSPETWEFTTHFPVDILDLLSELEIQYPTGIPCKNYLEGRNTSPYTQMDIKFLSIERKGATVGCYGRYVPFGGITLKIARVDLPN